MCAQEPAAPARPRRRGRIGWCGLSTILRVEGLTKEFPLRRGLFGGRAGTVTAVADVSFAVKQGEALGLAGESGSGKSTLAGLILKLLTPTSGSIVFDGIDVVAARRADLRRLRREVQIVFQDPSSSFDPRMTVAQIVAEGLPAELRRDRAARRTRTRELLDLVGLSDAALQRYPHEFSGGQRQ